MITAKVCFDPDSGWDRPIPELDSPRTLVIAFGATELLDDPAPVRQLRERFPQGHVVGCSTSGQIVGDSIIDGGLVALVIRFESGRIRVASTTGEEAGGFDKVGDRLGRELAGDDLRGVFVLSDGTQVNGTALATGLQRSLPAGSCVTGGLAGDGQRFERTWVACDGDPTPGAVAAVGLYGPTLHLWHGCQGGWDAFGPERVVTRSEGNVLYELDGRPALSIYEEYLGDKAAELPASALLFPLALRRADEEGVLVRTVLGVSHEDQSMTFAGDLPEGATVQLMQGNLNRVIDGASAAAGMISREALSEATSVCLPISCVGRRLILRHRAEDELDEVVTTLPSCAEHIGFYSYGELSPLVGSTCELHNQTMTLTVLAETRGAEHASNPRSSAA